MASTKEQRQRARDKTNKANFKKILAIRPPINDVKAILNKLLSYSKKWKCHLSRLDSFIENHPDYNHDHYQCEWRKTINNEAHENRQEANKLYLAQNPNYELRIKLFDEYQSIHENLEAHAQKICKAVGIYSIQSTAINLDRLKRSHLAMLNDTKKTTDNLISLLKNETYPLGISAHESSKVYKRNEGGILQLPDRPSLESRLSAFNIEIMAAIDSIDTNIGFKNSSKQHTSKNNIYDALAEAWIEIEEREVPAFNRLDGNEATGDYACYIKNMTSDIFPQITIETCWRHSDKTEKKTVKKPLDS